MKSLCLSILLALSLLLTGCSAGAEEKNFQNFSRELNEKSSLSFVSEIRCEYEDKTVNFTLGFEGNAEGCSVTVLAPRLISGIKANLKPQSTELEFEDVVLDTGNLDEYGLSPMSALPKLVKAMSQGHLESFHREDKYRVYEISADENCSVSVRFKEDEMIPVSAEIISEGKVKVFCKIGNLQ